MGLVMRDELLRLDSLLSQWPFLVQKYLDGNREKEMNGCWTLDPIGEGFYKLL
jgi:hypothetical protein